VVIHNTYIQTAQYKNETDAQGLPSADRKDQLPQIMSYYYEL